MDTPPYRGSAEIAKQLKLAGSVFGPHTGARAIARDKLLSEAVISVWIGTTLAPLAGGSARSPNTEGRPCLSAVSATFATDDAKSLYPI